MPRPYGPLASGRPSPTSEKGVGAKAPKKADF